MNPPKLGNINEPEREPEVRKEQDDPPEEQIEGSGSDEEGSLNISESNDSLHELKKVTAIPILKNNDKFKMSSGSSGKEAPLDSAALNRLNGRKSSLIIPFSLRVNLSDPY